MKIKESKNLIYDRFPLLKRYEGYDAAEPGKCFLESFNPVDDRIELYFKNGREAVIRAKNAEGGRELDLIENRLKDFIDRSYEEILDMNF